MATSNFSPMQARMSWRNFSGGSIALVGFAVVFLLSSAIGSQAQTNTNAAPIVLKTRADFEAHFRRNFWEAWAQYNKRVRPGDAYWKFARACFDVADYATNSA